MNIRKNLKRHKKVMHEIADLVLEEENDSLCVEIICRKLEKLGYLKLADNEYTKETK